MQVQFGLTEARPDALHRLASAPRAADMDAPAEHVGFSNRLSSHGNALRFPAAGSGSSSSSVLSPYYLVPNEPVGQEAFAVIRDAMRGKDMVALARIVLAKRERVVMLQSWDKGLLGTTLRYPYEVRDSEDYFDDIPEMKLPKDMLQLAEHILETKAGDFEPEKFEDRYENAVVEMIQRKRSGMPVPTERIAASPPNVVSLMDALKRSLAAEEAKTPQAATKAKKPKKAAAGQREMLLPISGKDTAGKEKTKEQSTAKAAAARQRKAS